MTGGDEPLPGTLRAVLADGVRPALLEDGIWTVMGAGARGGTYDRHAALYDRLIGNPLYNRIAWGTHPDRYTEFAAHAAAHGEGALLDAGCGSLVSTAAAHLASGRPAVLCDLSRGMLVEARRRVIAMAGRWPERLVLLQADIHDLPFRADAFGAVLCPGMLHLFEDVAAVTGELARVTAPDGRIFASSLVAERGIGSAYLRLLHKSGEVARPRSAAALLGMLEAERSGLAQPVEATRDGDMLFIEAAPAPR